MANGVQTQIKPEVLAIAGLLAVGGIALVLIGMGQGAGPGPVQEQLAGLTFQRLATPSNPNSTVSPTSGVLRPARTGAIDPTTGQPLYETITVVNPTYVYQGPGKSIFAFARLVSNNIYGNNATVFGSGLSGSFTGVSATPITRPMVPIVTGSPPQPSGCLGAGSVTPDLCMVEWPGAGPINICGVPAVPGTMASLVLEIWAFDGIYTNTSCGAKNLIRSATFPAKVEFV